MNHAFTVARRKLWPQNVYDQSGQMRKQSFALSPALAHLAQLHRLTNEPQPEQPASTATAVARCLSVVSFGPGQKSVGSLTCWGPEEEALCDWLGGLDFVQLENQGCSEVASAFFIAPPGSSCPCVVFRPVLRLSAASAPQRAKPQPIPAVEDIDELIFCQPCRSS